MAKKPSSSSTHISSDATTKTVSDITTDTAHTTDTVVAVIKPDKSVSTPSGTEPDELISSLSKSRKSKAFHRKSIKGKSSKLSEYLNSEPTTTTGVYEYPTNYGTSSNDDYAGNIYDKSTAPPQREIPEQPIPIPKSGECTPSDPDSPCQFYNRKKCERPAYSRVSNKKFHAVDKCSLHSNLNKPKEPTKEPIEEQKDSLKPILKTPDTSKYPDETYETNDYPTSYFTKSESTGESTSDAKPVGKTTGTTDTTNYPEESTKTTEYGKTDLSESPYESTSNLKPIGKTTATTDTTKYPEESTKTTEYKISELLRDSTDESATSEYTPSTAYLTSRMQEFGIVPDVLATYPSETLEVVYPNGVNVQLGNTLTPSQVKETPTVKWDADPNKYYLLCMTDPDSPSREEPKFREWNHWLVGNIPGDQVNEGETLSEYIGAGPPKGTGQHRYVFLLYLQNDELDFKREPRLTNKTADRRAKFSIKRIARRHKLGNPIAGNFFVAEWDTYVPKLHKQLNYPACLHLCQGN